MRYVGATPYLEQQMMEAEAAYNELMGNNLQNKKYGGNAHKLRKAQPGMETQSLYPEMAATTPAVQDPFQAQLTYYQSLPPAMDGEPGPGGYGTVGEFKMAPPNQQMEWLQWAGTQQQNQFDPAAMSPQNEQLINLLQEVDKAKGSEKTYRTPPKQLKKKGGSMDDSVELTTEQIAKIIAAGGSVKIL
jgi:hypothetical protein